MVNWSRKPAPPRFRSFWRMKSIFFFSRRDFEGLRRFGWNHGETHKNPVSCGPLFQTFSKKLPPSLLFKQVLWIISLKNRRKESNTLPFRVGSDFVGLPNRRCRSSWCAWILSQIFKLLVPWQIQMTRWREWIRWHHHPVAPFEDGWMIFRYLPFGGRGDRSWGVFFLRPKLIKTYVVLHLGCFKDSS